MEARVKVYEMTDSGKWLDKGTGHVQCFFDQHSLDYHLVVKSEVDGSSILNSRILQETEYARQQETLILWTDTIDLALSFQEQKSCDFVWDQIHEIQSRIAADMHDIDQIKSNINEDFGERMAIMPEITLKTIPELEQVFMVGSRNLRSRQDLTRIVMETDFMEKFTGLFSDCEDLDSLDDCYRLSNVVKCLFFLNHQELFKIFLSKEYFFTLIGMLEYDKEYPAQKQTFRSYFKQVTHKEIIPIPEMKDTIDLIFRAIFIKDVALARSLEDSTFNTLSQFIQYLQEQVVDHIISKPNLVDSIFQKIPGEGMLFLRELVMITKTFTSDKRTQFFSVLGSHGLFDIFEQGLCSEDMQVKLNTLAILSCTLEYNTQAARHHFKLLECLVKRMNEEQDEGLLSQICDCLKVFLDSSISEGVINPSSMRDEFIQILEKFYKQHCDSLFQSFHKDCFISPPFKYFLLLELTQWLITHHGLYSKNYFNQNDLVYKIGFLLTHPLDYIKLGAVKVLRSILHDPGFRKVLLKNDLLGMLLNCLLLTNGKDTLLNSALLEFFEFMRTTDDMKTLILYFVKKHRTLFEQFKYTNVFSGLEIKYEQLIDTPEPSVQTGRNEQQILVDHKEEEYFDKEDESEVLDKPLEFVKGGTLVGYDYEEEEMEEFVPKKVVRKALVSFAINPSNGLSSSQGKTQSTDVDVSGNNSTKSVKSKSGDRLDYPQAKKQRLESSL